jgi:hypothetical protein
MARVRWGTRKVTRYDSRATEAAPAKCPASQARGADASRRICPLSLLTDEKHPDTLADMSIQRMDNVGVVVDGLAGAIAFFAERGLELEGETLVEGRWVDRVRVSRVLKSTSQGPPRPRGSHHRAGRAARLNVRRRSRRIGCNAVRNAAARL